MKAQVKTALIVILLSCLIWVFAERESTQNTDVELAIELPTQPENLLVQFLDEQDNLIPDGQKAVKLTVEGPTRRILEVSEKYIKSKIIDITRFGTDLGNTNTQNRWIQIMAVLEGKLDSRDGKSYLQVVSTKPESLYLRLTKLTQQPLSVKVYDQDNIELIPQSISPTTINAYVPEGQPVEARINLTEAQRSQAVQAEIAVIARVTLPHRVSEFPVRLKLHKGELLKSDIRSPRLVINKPYSMEGKYNVVIEDITQLDDYKIQCRGTPEDMEKYINSDVHLILKISEDDLKVPSLKFNRPLIYYLPDEHGRIEITNKKDTPIAFHLEKIPEK